MGHIDFRKTFQESVLSSERASFEEDLACDSCRFSTTNISNIEGAVGRAGGGPAADTTRCIRRLQRLRRLSRRPYWRHHARLATSLRLNDISGVVVQSLDHDGPACKAGIKNNDVIVSVGGTKSATYEQMVELMKPWRRAALPTSRLFATEPAEGEGYPGQPQELGDAELHTHAQQRYGEVFCRPHAFGGLSRQMSTFRL